MLLKSTLVGARSTTLPAYMTMISSVRVATTPRSWVTRIMRHVPLALQLAEQVEDLRLHGDVEAGGGLVGQEQPRGAGQGDGDHDPLAHAARELEGVGLVALDRARGCPTCMRRESAVSLASAFGRASRWIRSDSVIWLPIRCTGLSDVMGSWKTMAIWVPQSSRSSSLGSVEDLRGRRSGPTPSGSVEARGSRPMIDRDSTVLPEPDSPDDAEGLALLQGERDPVDGLDGAAAGGERDVEVLDLEQGAGARRSRAHSLISVTSKYGAEPVADQVEAMRSEEHGSGREDRRARRWSDLGADEELDPSLSMLPQHGVGGWTDSPRKASEPSSTMIVATAIRPKDTIAGTTLGRISRARMRVSLAPSVLAAITKSRVANDRVEARTTRKMSGAPKMPMMSVIFHSVVPPEGHDGDDRHEGREGQDDVASPC